ncbi:hypothetical protein [Leptothermofonsia sp. ETS-13]|uniref:hypothetical protein n=1 Tax=Leptothermofonsia sp. ETS-13 TaxID=3035696 RepID=UPI003BA320A0
MTTGKPETQKTVFNTLNPTELKQATREDPIHKREGSHEADVGDNPKEEGAGQLGAQTGVDTAQSQIVNANL